MGSKVRMLQLYFQICYHITGEKLSPDRCNPLIAKFSEKLRNFKIERENYQAAVSVVSNSIFESVDTRLIKCSCQATFEIINTQESADSHLYGLQHAESAEIHNKLREITLTDGKYSHRIDFEIKDTVKASEPPMSYEQSPWPDARF